MENRSMKVAYISESPILSDFKKQKFLNRQQQISATYQTFGDIIQNLMKTLEIDTRKASELTGLNESFFRNLKNKTGKIEKRIIISIAVGFKLDFISTSHLLSLCGLQLVPQDFTDCAYAYLIEENKGRDIADHNRILEQLGVPEKYMLGTLERGTYRKRQGNELVM